MSEKGIMARTEQIIDGKMFSVCICQTTGKPDNWYIALRSKDRKNKAYKYSYNYEFLSELRDRILQIKDSGGSFEDAKLLLETNPAPKEPRKCYTTTARPMLYIYPYKSAYKPKYTQPNDTIYWTISIPWDGKVIRKMSCDLKYITELRDSLLKLRSKGGSYEDAVQYLDTHPAPLRPSKKSNQFNVCICVMNGRIGYWYLVLRKGKDNKNKVQKYSSNYEFLSELRDLILQLKVSGGSYEDAKQLIAEHSKAPRYKNKV